MPELPEVEVIRRQLEPELVGRRIERLEILDPRWSRPIAPAELEGAIAGREIEGLGRRGKYLLMALEGDETLVMHLRMTGNLLLNKPAAALLPLAREESDTDARSFPRPRRRGQDPPHLRARFLLDDGRQLWFTDPRRFGEAFLLDTAALEERFRGRLGVEPFSARFTNEALAAMAAGRRVPLKSFLLDQSGIAGVGNIYADEALFRARLHPLSPAGSLRAEHVEALRDGVIAALEAGIEGGGASIDDYRDALGEPGSMQDEFLVHTREGKDCPRCGREIRRIVVGGRSTYYCPGCQVRLRRRRSPARRTGARSG